MTISIASPNGTNREITLSPEMEKHFSIPINHSNTILNQINGGMYEKWFKGRKNLTCYDFGGNIGLVALYMLPACKKLIVVEPTPSHYNLMAELINKNMEAGQIILFSPNALTEKNEDVVFATGHATENKVSSIDGYGAHKITVKGQTLSSFIGENIVDFCKIDIEGYEIFALTEEQLKSVYGKVKTFFVECHPSNNYGMDDCREELIKRFINCGYSVDVEDYQTIIATI